MPRYPFSDSRGHARVLVAIGERLGIFSGQGCNGWALQVQGWSGRHPHGGVIVQPEPNPKDAVPTSVRELLQHINSIEKLEALLSLYGRRGRPWGAEDLAEELRVDAASLSAALSQLAAERMLEVHGSRYAYPSALTLHEEAMQWLAAAYSSDRMSIITLMAAQALQRIRSSAMRMFAEAFRIQEEPRD